MRSWTLALSLTAAAAACSGGSKPAPSMATTPTTPAGDPGKEMVARGAQLYSANCAGCHGNAGEGSAKAPAVVGAGALPLDPRAGQKRDVQFHTALDVFQWAKAHMPADKPGSLSDDEYLAIFAFDLTANGVDLHGKALDREMAAAIVLHP